MLRNDRKTWVGVWLSGIIGKSLTKKNSLAFVCTTVKDMKVGFTLKKGKPYWRCVINLISW